MDSSAAGVGVGAVRRVAGRVLSSRLLRRVASGAFWSVAGHLAARALILVAGIFVARQLGASRYGEYSLVLVTVAFFQNVAGFGLVPTSTKFLAGKYRSDPVAAGHVVALSRVVAATTGTVAMLAVAVAAPWIARDLLDAPQIERILRLGSVLLLFGPIYGAQLGVLTGLERFRAIAAMSTLTAAVSIPLLVLGAALGGTAGAIVAQVMSVGLSNALHGVAASIAMRRAGIVAGYRGAAREWRLLFSYGLPATLSNVLLGAVTWGSSVILARAPDGLREVGLYSAANQWRNGIVLVTTAAGAALLPVFSDLHDNGRSGTLRRAFWASFGLSAGACAAVAAVVMGVAPEIMRAYGAEFAAGAPVLVLLAVTGALAAPLTIAGHAIAGAGRMWLSLWLKLAWGGTLLSLAYALRTRGALGISLANVAAYALHLALCAAAVALLLRRREAAGAGVPASGA